MFSYQIQLPLICQYLNDNTTTLIKTNWNSITLESEGKKKRKKKEIYAKDRIFGPLDWFLYLQKPKHHRFITTKNIKFLSSPDIIHKSKCKLKLENRQIQRKKKLNPIGKTILCQNATKILKMQLQYFRCILCW